MSYVIEGSFTLSQRIYYYVKILDFFFLWVHFCCLVFVCFLYTDTVFRWLQHNHYFVIMDFYVKEVIYFSPLRWWEEWYMSYLTGHLSNKIKSNASVCFIIQRLHVKYILRYFITYLQTESHICCYLFCYLLRGEGGKAD